jgi:hypothetical protein
MQSQEVICVDARGVPLALTGNSAGDSVGQIYAEVRKRRAMTRLLFQTCILY